jgi:hypothetical protein
MLPVKPSAQLGESGADVHDPDPWVVINIVCRNRIRSGGGMGA